MSNDFEENMNMIDEILQKLESGELSLNESIKEYEEAMKLVAISSKILDKAEGKIFKVTDTSTDEI